MQVLKSFPQRLEKIFLTWNHIQPVKWGHVFQVLAFSQVFASLLEKASIHLCLASVASCHLHLCQHVFACHLPLFFLLDFFFFLNNLRRRNFKEMICFWLVLVFYFPNTVFLLQLWTAHVLKCLYTWTHVLSCESQLSLLEHHVNPTDARLTSSWG